MTTEDQATPDLRDLRKDRVLNQADLGTPSLISLYESGRIIPGKKVLTHLAEVLEVSPEAVLAACNESRRRGQERRAAESEAT